MARVTAIVPTLADSVRKASLLRAIASLQAATADPASVTIRVIVNGQRFDPELVARLRSMPVIVTQVEEGSLPGALAVGRKLVDTEYCCFLDDDDEYLPGAIDERVAALDQRPELSMLVTNGWVSEDDTGTETRMYDHLPEVERDAQRALFRANWFASCGSLMRANRIHSTYFDDYHDFLEWTWLAFRITADGHRIGVLDKPTFRIHNTSGSRSKSLAYAAAQCSLYTRMLRINTRADIRSLLHVRLQNQWSMYSMTALQEGDLAAAWKAYGQVVRYHGALRYGSHVVRLLFGSLRQMMGPPGRGARS